MTVINDDDHHPSFIILPCCLQSLRANLAMQLSLELHIRVMHRCGTGDITAITACLSQVLG